MSEKSVSPVKSPIVEAMTVAPLVSVRMFAHRMLAVAGRVSKD